MAERCWKSMCFIDALVAKWKVEASEIEWRMEKKCKKRLYGIRRDFDGRIELQ